MNRRIRWAVMGILTVAAFLRFVGLGTLSLIGDESYYWLWSRRPAWAYYDHPAGVAFLIRASTGLGGSGEAGVRWLNALLGTGCVFLTYWLGQRMLSRRAGLFAAILVATGAPYLITSRFVYTNTLHLFLVLLNLLTFWHLATEPVPRLGTAAAFGGSLALVFNTKYSAYVYAGTLLVAVLVDHRRLLTNWRSWVGVLVGVSGLVPVVAWNAAHGWVSFRWQFLHATTTVADTYSLLGNAHHALVYLTWPLVVAALVGVGTVRTPAERLLSLLALFSLLPVALSPANSPRNLTDGLIPLLLLAGTRLPSSLRGWRQRAVALALAGTVLVTAVYGAGTVANLSRSCPWPHSSIVPAILRDAAGWQELGSVLAPYREPLFALDYSIAAQIWYYADRPAYTGWGQYRIWGIPDLDDVVIISLDYLPQDLVSAHLTRSFHHVEGPRPLSYSERGATKEVRIWQARGLHRDQETFLRTFDFLTLLEAAR